MAVPGLYIPIRGDYSQFQQDMNRVAGIARENAKDIAEALNLAISPDKVYKGLKGIGSALKQLTAAAQSTGKAFYAPIRELDELAKKANVASGVVEELHYAMINTARDHQIEQNLRAIQKQCGLTEDAVARLQAQMGDTAGSIDTAMKALGVRSAQAIQKEIRSLEASFDHALKHGGLTVKEQERLLDAYARKVEALNREMGVMPFKSSFAQARETLGIRETGDVRAEAQQARQAYEVIQQSAWKTREMSVASHEAMIASLKKLAQELRLTASETSKFIAAFAGSRDALDSTMGAMGLKSTRAIKQEIAEVNRLLHRVESSASATLEDKERALAWAAKRTDALTREMRAPGQLTANERYEQATGLLGMKTDSYYRQQAKAIAQAYLEVRTNARSSAEDVSRAHAKMVESFRQLRAEMTAWKPQTQTVDPAKIIGVRTNKEIYADIAALQQAFMQFSLAPGRAADEVERAKARMQTAIRELYREMGVVSAQDKRDGFLKLLGIRSIEEIEKDKQALINAHRQIVDEFSKGIGGWSEQDLRNSLAARNAGLQRLAQEAGTWQAGARAEVSPLRQKYNTLSAQAGGAGVSFGQYEAKSKASEAVKAFQELHGRLPKYAKEFRDLAAAAGTSTREIWKMRDALDHSSSAFKALIGYGQVWLTFGFAHTALDFVKTAMALENVKVAFTAIYGTADMADKKLEYVRQISDQLGLSFLDTAEGAKKLFAAANGTPVEREANKVFRAFSNMSAAMKLTGDETKGVFLALSQMISKGKVSAEELRQQLAERMPGAVNLFAKSIGKSTQELDKMLQKGEVTLEHFLKFADAVDMTYSAGAEAAGHSLQAELNRVKNTWIEFQERMTDTGQLASLVSGFNSVLKETLGIFEKVAPYVDDIATAGLAAWIGSSVAAGGKLNAVLGAMAGGFKKITHNLKTFAAVSAASAAPVGNLSKALGGLKIAMVGIGKNPALLAFFTAMAGVLALNAYQAKRAARAYADVQKGMEEKLAEEAKRKEADEASSFNPDKIRESMISDSKQALADFKKEAVKAQQDVDRYLERSQANVRAMAYSEMLAVDEGLLSNQKKVVTEAQYNIENWASALNAALKNKSAEQAGDVLKHIKEESGALLNNLRAADVDNTVFQILNRQISDLESKASKLFINLTKWGDTFSAESTSAAKRLGVDLAELDKQFGKIRDAASKTDFGKALNSLKDMDKVREIMHDTTMAYDANAAAMAGQLQQMQGFVSELGNMGSKYDEHNDKLMEMMMAFDGSDEALEKIRLKEEELVGEHDLLNTETDKVATAIVRLAASAGGTDAQFNIMISALQAAQQAGVITEQALDAVIAKVRQLQGEAQSAMIQAQSALNVVKIDRQTRLNDLGVRGRIARKKGDVDELTEVYAGQERTRLDRDITSEERAALRRRAESDIKGDKLWESFGKGGRGKGGGSKRVDNTAEKYDSAFEGFRKEIAKLQGEVDLVTLDKKFADMNKQLVGSKHNIQQLKKDYYEAFNVHALHEFDKTMYQLVGNERALADIDIEEKLKAQQAQFDGMNKAAQELGLATVDYTAKMEAYRKALENNKEEQYLQKLIPVYEEIASKDEDKVKILELQNKLIEIQAEKMLGSFPPEVVERWREMQMLEHSRNPWDGIILGLKKYSMETESLAKTMSSAVGQAFDGMADAFVQFATTGKFSFKDMANSIIADLMRITVKSMILGPIANAIGGALGSLFNFGGATSAVPSVAGKIGGAASGIAAGASFAGGSALGNVFTGLHGYSNQIVSRPTLFSYGSQLTRFAKGGVMGEAGPEAVMPLTRMGNGRLGVQVAGGDAMSLSLTIVDKTQGGIGVEDTQASQNGIKIDLLVQQLDSKLAGLAASGKSRFVGAMEKTHRMPSKRGWN